MEESRLWNKIQGSMEDLEKRQRGVTFFSFPCPDMTSGCGPCVDCSIANEAHKLFREQYAGGDSITSDKFTIDKKGILTISRNSKKSLETFDGGVYLETGRP